ncbi:MAG: Trp biosynthesis-associated membrane protein [Actinobacteria bacterium]|nr:Trp biosynthesis-associated membrane protein [Actinomycetota bacterium]
MTGRRALRAVQAASGLGGLVALGAASQVWLRVAVPRDRPLPDAALALSGRTVAPLVTALAVAGLAGLVGLFATRGWGRVVLGGLLAIIGAALIAAAVPHAWAPGPAAVDDLLTRPLAGRDPTRAAVATTVPGWPLLAAGGGAVLVAAGLATVARGRRWPGMSSRFEVAGQRAGPPRAAPDGPPADAAVWDALDRGDDPTL